MPQASRSVKGVMQAWSDASASEIYNTIVSVAGWTPTHGGYLEAGVMLTIECIDEQGCLCDHSEIKLSHAAAANLGRLLVAAGKMKDF